MTGGKPERIQSIDALRGLCVLLMCIHHFLYDMAAFLGAPWWIFTNPVFDTLHYLFAGCFILLSGVSSRFSRSNLRRGGKLIAVALALTLVTCLADWLSLRLWGEDFGVRILFGVLHLLGFCMVFYGLTARWLDRLPGPLLPLLCLVLLILTAKNVSGLFITDQVWLFPFGYLTEGFYSADYFPILPWIFVFLAGTWLGGLIREGKLPPGFYTARFPFFPQLGRHALLIYLLHQPILAGLTLLIGAVFGIL